MDRGGEWTMVMSGQRLYAFVLTPPPPLDAYIINGRPLVLLNEPDNTYCNLGLIISIGALLTHIYLLYYHFAFLSTLHFLTAHFP